jgi:hypothetical protein
MLTIRKDQMRVLAEARLIDLAAAQARGHFAAACNELGSGLNSELRGRLRAANRYGLTEDRDVLLYVSLTFALGPNFDADPRYPWAADILNAGPSMPPWLKAARLYENALRCAESSE